MRKNTLKNLLIGKIPEDKINSISKSYEIVGDIAIIEIPIEVEKYENEIAKALMNFNKNIKTVLKKSGIHQGEFRTQDLTYLLGEDKKETEYLENGIKLKINPQTVYFSARLSTERGELMSNLEKNKRILIMFSGAGPYTFVALKKQSNISKIDSIEINPQGHKYALESLKLNKNILMKSKIYIKLEKFVKENQIPIKYKELINLLNNIKINFFNEDVKIQANKFTIREYTKEVKYFENDIFLKNNLEIFNELKEKNNIFLDLNTFEKKEILSLFLILFSSKLSFICKIKNKNYIFETNIEKSYLLDYLENKREINSIYKYDEIFMPLPKDASLFLDSAFKLADKNCIIHLYDFVHENDFPKQTENSVYEFAKENNYNIEIISTRKVGQYSPRKFRVCCDFKIL